MLSSYSKACEAKACEAKACEAKACEAMCVGASGLASGRVMLEKKAAGMRWQGRDRWAGAWTLRWNITTETALAACCRVKAARREGLSLTAEDGNLSADDGVSLLRAIDYIAPPSDRSPYASADCEVRTASHWPPFSRAAFAFRKRRPLTISLDWPFFAVRRTEYH
jgi:hypothetical protein